MKQLIKSVMTSIGIVLLMMLTACGGGSGGGGNPGGSGPPPVIDASAQPPVGVVGTPYPSFTFTATGGRNPLTWSESGTPPPGLALNNAGVLAGTPTSNGSFAFTVMVQDKNGQAADPQEFTIRITLPGQATGFTATGSLGTGRSEHTATLLQSNKVLVAGGSDTNANSLPTVELYDPAAGTFAATGSMAGARTLHTATLLKDGRVLIAGGADTNANPLATAEIFNPATGTFSAAGNMGAARAQHTATLLNSGKVLIAGGVDSTKTPLASAELFDPTSGTFAPAGNMGSPRARHTATLLVVPQSSADGKVLVAGGIDGNLNAAASAELFDPSSGTFAPTGTMQNARAGHAAVQLSNARVLVVGGDRQASAELFDPASGTFAATGSMSTQRTQFTVTVLGDGTVLAAGGGTIVTAPVCGNNCITDVPLSLGTAEIFDPAKETFEPAGEMTATRLAHTAMLLSGGKVLVIGGAKTRIQGRQFLSTANSSADLFE